MTEKLLRMVRYITVLIVISISTTAFASEQRTAKSIFESWRSQVYQIRVIDIASADKFSIGSGFLVSRQGHVATNFHVVSSYVHEPKKYRLELVHDNGDTAPINLLAIDVIHDLAIAQVAGISAKGLVLSKRLLQNGDRMFSMGNPHDLGMTVIEGNYNGFVQHVRHKQILFSGSLNSGMSGGPAFNAAGEVIGVNVAKGGEQIGFLVPVEYLSALLSNMQNQQGKDFEAVIAAALLADQQQFFGAIVNKPVEQEVLEQISIPVNMADTLKCWGHTEDKDDYLYKSIHQHCRSEDQIFISDRLIAGHFSYDYEWIATDELNAFQFYKAVQSRFRHTDLANSYDEEEVSDFACHTERVDIAEHQWKISSCMRAYVKYPGLYDVSMVMASLDYSDKALVAKLGASAISKDNAARLIRYMMEHTQWSH